MSTVRSLDVAVRANTQQFEGGMRKVSQALRGAVQGLNAVTAASAAQEKNFLQIANSLAIGYAAGGPWGLALSGAGVGLGLLIGHFKELKEATDASTASQKKFADEMGKMASANFGLREQIAFIRGTGREGTPEELKLGRLMRLRNETQEIQDIHIENARTDTGFGSLRGVEETTNEIRELDEEIQRLQQTIALQSEKSGLLEDIDATAKAADEAAKRLREEMGRVPLVVGVAADAVFALLDGIIIRGAKAQDVMRSVAQSIASIGLRAGVNAAFSIATPS